MRPLSQKKLFMLDMDGTIYLDEYLFDGTRDFLREVKLKGGSYLYMTNNSSKNVTTYIEKLARMGIEAFPEEFLTSTYVTVLHLKEKSYKKIYTVGTADFVRELRKNGLPVTEKAEDDVDCVLVGNDNELTFEKLYGACKLLTKGAPDFVATNPDPVCPVSFGYVPDCGSICDMITNSTGKRPLYLGKPKPDMPLRALELYGYDKDDAVIVGDRIYTDIACGVNAGIDSVFVLSGEGVESDIEKYGINPCYVMNNIRELYEAIKNK